MPDTIELERYELFAGPGYRFEPDRRDFFKLLSRGISGIPVLLKRHFA